MASVAGSEFGEGEFLLVAVIGSASGRWSTELPNASLNHWIGGGGGVPSGTVPAEADTDVDAGGDKLLGFMVLQSWKFVFESPTGAHNRHSEDLQRLIDVLLQKRRKSSNGFLQHKIVQAARLRATDTVFAGQTTGADLWKICSERPLHILRPNGGHIACSGTGELERDSNWLPTVGAAM